jgi:hypothetical protein
MRQTSGLAADRRGYRGVTVAERVHSNSTQEVQIALAVDVPEIYPATALEKDGLPFVSWEQKFRFQAGNGREAHARNTSVPHSIFEK